jgi:selenocysteine lyase/cysteine desulfurase
MLKSDLRALFPVTRNLAYFNHAAVGPLSVRAYQAMEGHARDQRDFGAAHWREWYAEDDRLRASAAKLIGAAANEIAILKNTTEGLAFVAEGLPWERGDNVVTTALEFPSNYVPWKVLEARGVDCRVVQAPEGAFTVDDVAAAIDGRTRVVAVSSVAFHNGFAADLDAIGDLCAHHQILFCVDAIQSLGVKPMDVKRSKISFLAADGHKWLCGPEGAAIFYAAAEHREKLRVIENGWTNIDRKKGSFLFAPTDLLPDARRFEAGSLNTNGIYGLRAAIDLLLEIGIETIETEVIRLANRLAEGVEAIGFRIGSPRPIHSGIVGAIPPFVDSRELIRLHSELDRQGIICAPREGMLRFSAHFYNDDEEVDRVVDELKRLTTSR